MPPSDDDLLLELLLRKRSARTQPPAASTATRPGAWRCLFKECPAAEKGRLNFANNPTCRGCGRVKHKAMSPPLLQRVPPPEPTTAKSQRGRTTQKKTSTETPAPTTSAKVTAAASAQEPADSSPGLLAALQRTFSNHTPAKLPKPLTPSGSSEAERVGALALKQVDVEQLFRRPTTTPTPLPSADEVVAKASPLRASAALASQQAEVQATKAALASLETLGRDHHLCVELNKALQQQEAALAKLNKNAPSGKVLVQELLTAKAEQTEEMARWEDHIAAGQRKAKGRLDEQFQALDAMIAEATKRRAAVAEAHAKAEQAWQLFNQERRAQHTAVINQFDAKIAAAQIEAARDAVALQVVAAPLAVAQAPTPPVDALAQVQADGAAAQQALLKAQEEYQRLLAARNAAETLGPPQLQRFECVQEDLPTMLPEPSQEHWQQLYALNSALEALNAHEMFSGLVFPVTFGQLRCGTEVPRLLLGDKLWGQAFHAEAATESSLVTLQVRQLLRHSLQKHQAKLLQDQASHLEATEQAAMSVNTAVDEFRDKKRKVEALSADAA